MEIRMLTGLGGLTFSHAPGDLVTVPDHVGAEWIAVGMAEAVAADPANETTRPPRKAKG